MRNRVLTTSTFILLAASVFTCLGCETDQAVTCGTCQLSDGSSTTVQPKNQFYYYPTSQVYRDCQVDRWFWLSAGNWESGKSLPAAVQLGDEIPFAVELACENPTEQHALIVGEYPRGSLDSTNASATTEAE